MKNKYYFCVFCVSENGQQFVFKIKSQNQNKKFATSFARSLLSDFRNVFIVHCEGSLVVLRSLVRGRLFASPKVVSVF